MLSGELLHFSAPEADGSTVLQPCQDLGGVLKTETTVTPVLSKQTPVTSATTFLS